MFALFENIKNWFNKYWLLISSLVIAILTFILIDRSKKISQLTSEIKLGKIKGELEALTKESEKSDEKALQSKKRYDDLKRLYPDIVARLGLRDPK